MFLSPVSNSPFYLLLCDNYSTILLFCQLKNKDYITIIRQINLNDIFADIKGIDIANSDWRYINKIADSFFHMKK